MGEEEKLDELESNHDISLKFHQGIGESMI
jgi:hypothetical protein